ncbi:MAG: hypothetical protein DCF32_06245 [Leptolyngbya sp.]|nr:MAG: hypothetical protein DCF32_06245 [Leptolyngbya sp.]
MALPDNFSEAEHLQDLFRRYANRQVREFFSDLGGEDWEPDIGTTRGSLRHGATHKDDDSLPMTLLRWELFNYVRRLKFDVPMMGIPLMSNDVERKYKPQIFLNFIEDLGDVDAGYAPVTGLVSFRLMDHTSETITPTIAQTYANRIKTNFSVGSGYVWRKGRTMVTYSDWKKGYQLQILCRSESNGRDLIDRVLDIQNDTIDTSKLVIKENQNESAAYPIIPPNDRIYGETRRTPRKRPLADVRFQYAVLHVHGLSNGIPLVDRTSLYPSALAS